MIVYGHKNIKINLSVLLLSLKCTTTRILKIHSMNGIVFFIGLCWLEAAGPLTMFAPGKVQGTCVKQRGHSVLGST